MLPSPQTENKLVYGYVRNEEHNVIRAPGPLSTIPITIIQMVLEYYRNHNCFQWSDQEKMNEFLNTKSGQSFETKPFKIKGVEGITFNFAIYPNGTGCPFDNSIYFSLKVELNAELIKNVVANLTLCSPEISQFYARTIMINHSGYYGGDNSINSSQCKQQTAISFVGKIDILSIECNDQNAFKNYSNIFVKMQPLMINKSGIKLEREISCKFNKIYGMSKNILYSGYFGTSKNWMFIINTNTNKISLRLMYLPSEIMTLRIFIKSKQLSPPEQQWRISYSNDTICLGKLGKGKYFEFPFECLIEIDTVISWNWRPCREENWAKIGLK